MLQLVQRIAATEEGQGGGGGVGVGVGVGDGRGVGVGVGVGGVTGRGRGVMRRQQAAADWDELAAYVREGILQACGCGCRATYRIFLCGGNC